MFRKLSFALLLLGCVSAGACSESGESIDPRGHADSASPDAADARAETGADARAETGSDAADARTETGADAASDRVEAAPSNPDAPLVAEGSDADAADAFEAPPQHDAPSENDAGSLPPLDAACQPMEGECQRLVCENGQGIVQKAADGTACAGGVCLDGMCHPASCTDHVENNGETDVDCGGDNCPACGDGRHCNQPRDCSSGKCSQNVCQPPTCNDGVKNGTETSTDCGGSCSPCADGKPCVVGKDCESAVCRGFVCIPPNCSDGVKNAGETDVDCGGPLCMPCAIGRGCLAARDCATSVCTTNVCQPPACQDGVTNGAETDVDCGGGTCPACGIGSACVASRDCLGRRCDQSTCKVPTCSDGIADGAETDVDCGGMCTACAFGRACASTVDCGNGECFAGRCAFARFDLEEARSYPVSGGNFVSAVADFDRDGRADVVMTGGAGASFDVSLNRGGLAPPLRFTTGGSPRNLTVGDLNRDGYLDVAVSCGGSASDNYANAIYVHLNDKGEWFNAGTRYALAGAGQGVIVDLDGDGRTKLVVAHASGINIYPVNADGTLASPKLLMSSGIFNVGVYDIDGDGDGDIVATGGGNSTKSALVYTNEGGGNFSAPTLYDMTSGRMFSGGDLDNDGKIDLLMTGTGTSTKILHNIGGGRFASMFIPGNFTLIGNHMLFDVDSNGSLDIAVPSSSQIQFWTNPGNAQFVVGPTIGVSANALSTTVGDFNGDCRLDFLQTKPLGTSILYGRGHGTFSNPQRLGYFPTSLSIADWNGDARADLAGCSSYNGTEGNCFVLFNRDGKFSDQDAIGGAAGPNTNAAVGDLNEDGRPDFATVNGYGSILRVVLSTGATTFAPAVVYTPPRGAGNVVIGDINGDGHRDVVVGGGGGIDVFLGDGSGKVTLGQSYLEFSSIGSMVLMGDGPRPSIAYVVDITKIAMMQNQGGTFGPESTLYTGMSPSALHYADADGDGSKELILVEHDANAAVVLWSGGAVGYSTDRGPSDIACGDMNGDGRPDLVVTHDTSQSFGVLLGQGNRQFTAPTSFDAAGVPINGGGPMVGIADFDADGKNDVASAGGGITIVRNLSGAPALVCPVCGDGVVGEPEVCDDGGFAAGDGCAKDCKLEPGWSCVGSPSVCVPVCGDGLLKGGETCDDGSATGADGCSAGCRIETGYSCTGEPSACAPMCGDGLVAGDEVCDDRNTADDDGCASTCRHDLWSRGYGDFNYQVGTDVAVDKDGNVAVIGTYSGAIDFGGGPLTASSTSSGFVAKLGPSAIHIFSKGFTASVGLGPSGAAFDKDANLVVVGSFNGTANFGSGPVADLGSGDVFVMKLDPSGNVLFAKRFGGTGQDTANGVAVDAAGNIYVAGRVNGSIDFGGGVLASKGYDAFLLKLDSSGNHVWSKMYGDSSQQEGLRVTVTTDGNVVFSGTYEGTIDFGVGAHSTFGASNLFAAGFTSGGTATWSRSYGDANVYEQIAATAPIAGGGVVMVGSYDSPVDLGGGKLPRVGGREVFVLELDASGNHMMSRGFAAAGNQQGGGVSVDAAGNIFIGGSFEQSIDFGGGPLPASGGSELFVAKLDSNGNHIWSWASKGTAYSSIYRLAGDAAGRSFITGAYTGTLTIGRPPLPHGPDGSANNVVLAKFAP
jgi:cysteine-rich repeat protein